MNARSPDAASGALALALLCSGLAALPAFLRVVPEVGAGWAAAALLGAVSLVVVPVGGWLRRARSTGMPATDRALAAGIALSALPLALFGGVLKSTTHHRPLGGVTFAVAALGVLALCIGLALRVFVRPASSGGDVPVGSVWQTLFTLASGFSLAAALALALTQAVRPSLVDFLALAGGVAASAWLRVPRWLERPAVWPAATVWVLLLAGTAASLSRPELVRSIATQAPVAFATVSWLGAGS